MTFQFIAENTGAMPVKWMCEALEVSESGYHARRTREPSATARRHVDLVAAIEVIHAEVKGRYDSPRLTAELLARGHTCSENTVARLMNRNGIRARGEDRSGLSARPTRGLTNPWPRTSWVGPC